MDSGRPLDDRAHRRLKLVLALTTVAWAFTGPALAASSYSVQVGVPQTVKAGHAFVVKLTGFSKDHSSLSVYLDRQSCARTSRQEAQQASKDYRQGDSSFANSSGEAGPWQVNFFVTGTFKESPRAQAGTLKGKRYVCAYLYFIDPRAGQTANRARATASYSVTR